MSIERLVLSDEPLAVICRKPRDSDIARMVEASQLASVELVADKSLGFEEVIDRYMRRIYAAVVRGGEMAD